MKNSIFNMKSTILISFINWREFNSKFTVCLDKKRKVSNRSIQICLLDFFSVSKGIATINDMTQQ